MNRQDKKLRIAMVAACPFPANHGSPASIREMSEALVRQGHEVHIVTYPIKEDIPVDARVDIHRVHVPFLRNCGVKVGPSYEKFLFDPLMVIKLVWTIWKYKIDVIHAHNYEGALVGWLAKLFTGRPMLYNAVNSMADELPTYNFIKPKRFAVWLGEFLDNVVPRTGDFVTVVSDSLKTFLLGKKVPESRVVVVPAGVNLDMFDQGSGERVREKHGLQGRPLVVYTGTLEQFQRIDYLLQAMRDVVREMPEACLLLVGNIPHKANQALYTDMAASLGIGQSVRFIDSVSLDELPDYLAAADVTVVPRPECPGHPVKLLNYMAAGRPVVSFEGGAKGLHHMYNGYLVNDHDTAAFGEGVVALLRDPELAASLGRHARSTITGHFDWDTLTQGIVLIYWMMLEKRYDAAAHSELARYLHTDYLLRFVERDLPLSEGHTGSRVDRRQSSDRIGFAERRQVTFVGAEPLPQLNVKKSDGPAAEDPPIAGVSKVKARTC
ncbi:MAG TPA: glycosyltransferase family 4 protein [Thiobacillus sp.]|nr:glycosyltransferase family 4 protein [Thiobacillus sp.]